MATDLFELLGPLSEAQARRLVQLMRLAPDQRARRADRAADDQLDTVQQDHEAA